MTKMSTHETHCMDQIMHAVEHYQGKLSLSFDGKAHIFNFALQVDGVSFGFYSASESRPAALGTLSKKLFDAGYCNEEPYV